MVAAVDHRRVRGKGAFGTIVATGPDAGPATLFCLFAPR
jgi:hypothetical protein